MRHVVLLTALLLLPLAFAACGDDEAGDAPADPAAKAKEPAIPVTTWQEEGPPPPPQEPGSRKEYVKIQLPSAIQARKFPSRGAFVFNCFPDGTMVFKGHTYRLEGDSDERAASLTAIREQAAALTEDGARSLYLHADRLVPWSVISTLIVEAMQWKVKPPKIVIAAFRPPDGWEHALGGTWTEAGEQTAADRDAVPVTLGFRPGEETPTFHMVVGRNNWTLGRVPETFNDARFLKAMNRTWRKVADYLQTDVRGEKHASLAIQPNENGVWLAHVVTMLDVLASAGIEEVLFPVEGLRLRFEGR